MNCGFANMNMFKKPYVLLGGMPCRLIIPSMARKLAAKAAMAQTNQVKPRTLLDNIGLPLVRLSGKRNSPSMAADTRQKRDGADK